MYLGDYNKGSNVVPGYPINPWFEVSISTNLDCPTCLSFVSLSLGSMGDDQIFPVNAYILNGKSIIPDQIYAIPYMSFGTPGGGGGGHADPYLLKINGVATQEGSEIKILLNKYVKYENETSFQFSTTKTIYLTRI